MIIEPADWWRGDRFKSAIFGRVRQLIFEVKASAFDWAPRRKTDITLEAAEAVIAAAAVAVGWRDDDREQWREAASLLRRIADDMEEGGLRSLAWGPHSTFSTGPVTFPATLTRDGDGYFSIEFPDLPECLVGGAPEDDAGAMASVALNEAIWDRLTSAEDVPAPKMAIHGQVDVTLDPWVSDRLIRFWSYGQRPKPGPLMSPSPD